MDRKDRIDDGRQVSELRDGGRTWTQVADDLRISTSQARRLATRYRERVAAVVAREQLPLFDLSDLS